MENLKGFSLRRSGLKAKDGGVLLDDLDKAILRTLQKNARQTYTEIGRSLKLAHSTIYDRIKKMERHGVIQRYTVKVEPRKAGLKLLTAVVTVFTEPKENERVAKQLTEYPEATEVYTSLSEELSTIVKVVAKDQESLHTFISTAIAPLPGVLRIRTSIITRKHKEENLAFK